MSDRPRVLAERDWLIRLVEAATGASVPDAGFSFRDEVGDFVYDSVGERFEVTIKELARGIPAPQGSKRHVGGAR